jgi:hypothetical protein
MLFSHKRKPSTSPNRPHKQWPPIVIKYPHELSTPLATRSSNHKWTLTDYLPKEFIHHRKIPPAPKPYSFNQTRAEINAPAAEPQQQQQTQEENTVQHPVAQTIDSVNFTHERILMNAINKQRKDTQPNDNPTVPTIKEIQEGVAKYGHHMRSEHKKLLKLQFIRNQQDNPYKRRQLPPHVDPATLYPTKTKLMATTKFGKSNKTKVYTVTPAAPHILLPLLKSGFLSTKLIETIRQADTRTRVLVDAYYTCKTLDFRVIQHPSFDWDITQEINRPRMFLRMAALLHYDLDIATVQRYSGWRFTGDHRRRDEMLHCLRYVLQPKTYQELYEVYINGAPKHLVSNKYNDYDQYTKYRQKGNLPNVAEHPALVAKGFGKEDAREITMFFPSSLADFIPHLGLIPLGINVMPDRKPRMYRHGSYQVDGNSYPVNRLVDITTEPEITFGDCLLRHLEYMWRLRATFPTRRQLNWDDDISGAFNQVLMHPDVCSGNASIWQGHIVQCYGMHFGGNFCPPNFEPVARARCELVEYLYHNATYQIALNQEVLDLTTVDLPTLQFPLAQATLDNPEDKQCDDNGNFKVQFAMYVDDGQSAVLANDPTAIHTLITSSVEAAYILLGYPGPIQQPTIPATMSWDKMVDRPIRPSRECLGLVIDTDKMEVTIPVRRLNRLDKCIRRNWNHKRKQFTARGAAQLIGNLLSCLQGCQWMKMATFHLQSALRKALRNNATRIAKSRHFQAILAEKNEAWLEVDSSRKEAKLLGLQSKLARILWRCEEKTFIPANVHRECEWIRQIIQEHYNDGTTWTRPISHIVRRKADWEAYQDASTKWGMGGHSPDLRYYWQISWHQLGQCIVDKIAETLNKGKDDDIHINWLEYAATVINYAATIVSAQEPQHRLAWAPKALFHGDNTTANRVAKKGTIRSDSTIARAVARVHGGLQRCCNIATDSDHIAGIKNEFADALSRGTVATWLTKITTMSTNDRIVFFHLQTKDQLTCTVSYRQFLPSQELLSAISTAILQPNRVALLPILNATRLGRLLPASNISTSLSAAACISMTSR